MLVVGPEQDTNHGHQCDIAAAEDDARNDPDANQPGGSHRVTVAVAGQHRDAGDGNDHRHRALHQQRVKLDQQPVAERHEQQRGDHYARGRTPVDLAIHRPEQENAGEEIDHQDLGDHAHRREKQGQDGEDKRRPAETGEAANQAGGKGDDGDDRHAGFAAQADIEEVHARRGLKVEAIAQLVKNQPGAQVLAAQESQREPGWAAAHDGGEVLR